MSRIVVLGAGISGLTLGWRLVEAGVNVTIIEKEPIVGGLAATVRHGSYCLDYGPHSFFSEDDEIVQTVLDLFEKPPSPSARTVQFHYKGKYLDYPLTPQNVLFHMGFLSGIQSSFSFLVEKLKFRSAKKEYENVEDWAVRSFGRHLYRTFFKPYTEQFWKTSCDQLSPRSIPTHTRMSFTNTLRVLFNQKVTKSGESLIEREKLPTYYPNSGYGEISELVCERFLKNGGKLFLNSHVKKIYKKNNAFQVGIEGQNSLINGDMIVSTIPINLFVSLFNPLPSNDIIAAAEKLDYRGLLTLSLVTEKQDVLSSSYMYMLNRPYNRISEMNKFSPNTSPEGKNILMLEIPCVRGGSAWRTSKEEHLRVCLESLEKDGFLKQEDVIDSFLQKADHAYPVYSKDYADNLKVVLNWIDSVDRIHTLGRTGEFMYMDIDKCMRRAFQLADKLKKDILVKNKSSIGLV